MADLMHGLGNLSGRQDELELVELPHTNATLWQSHNRPVPQGHPLPNRRQQNDFTAFSSTSCSADVEPQWGATIEPYNDALPSAVLAKVPSQHRLDALILGKAQIRAKFQ